jgi:integrase/recombinase XerD
MQVISPTERKFERTEFKPYIVSFKLDCLVRNLTPKTLKCHLERLGYLFSYLSETGVSFKDVTKQTIQAYIVTLQERVSEETINGRLRVYRRFFRFLIEEDLWEGPNPLKGISLLRTSRKLKSVVTPEELQKVLKGLNTRTFEGSRNLVMLLFFWDSMIRLTEMLTLRISDIDLETGLIKVFGKGRKERMIPIGVKTVKQVQKYLHKRKCPGDLLICMRNGEPIKARHCHKIVQSLGKKQGIKLYPHLLRHSAATWYANQGGNLAVLQRILGHTSLAVTQNYLHLTGEDLTRDYQRFSPGNAIAIG